MRFGRSFPTPHRTQTQLASLVAGGDSGASNAILTLTGTAVGVISPTAGTASPTATLTGVAVGVVGSTAMGSSTAALTGTAVGVSSVSTGIRFVTIGGIRYRVVV